MNIRRLTIALSFFLVLVSLASGRPVPDEESLRIQCVVIDAGHGGHDNGCSGKHSKEKHIALKLALKLGGLIEKAYPDVKVVYTRNKDVFVELHERAAIANRAEADLFISIHCNAATAAAYGTETYVMGLHKEEANLSVAKRENASILLESDYEENYDGFDPNSPEGHILLSIFQNAYLHQSILFAEKVEKEFVVLGRRSRGVKQAGFLVLYKTAMPSVLIESGFLTNLSEEAFLRDEENQWKMARGIFNAFSDYKKEFEPEFETREAPIAETQEKIEKDEAMVPKAVQGLQYHVQIMAAKKAIKASDKRFKGKGQEFLERKEGKLFKYFFGTFAHFEDAASAQKNLREGGFQDCFVVAYLANKKITITEALALQE